MLGDGGKDRERLRERDAAEAAFTEDYSAGSLIRLSTIFFPLHRDEPVSL